MEFQEKHLPIFNNPIIARKKIMLKMQCPFFPQRSTAQLKFTADSHLLFPGKWGKMKGSFLKRGERYGFDRI